MRPQRRDDRWVGEGGRVAQGAALAFDSSMVFMRLCGGLALAYMALGYSLGTPGCELSLSH